MSASERMSLLRESATRVRRKVSRATVVGFISPRAARFSLRNTLIKFLGVSVGSRSVLFELIKNALSGVSVPKRNLSRAITRRAIECSHCRSDDLVCVGTHDHIGPKFDSHGSLS